MSALWGITAFFNPVGYRGKSENYRLFRAASRRQGLPLVTVELVFGDDAPVLGAKDAERHVVVRGNDTNVLWQKEALLNIALDHLPAEARFVAWLDADVLFANEQWIEHTCQALEQVPVVQPYRHFVQLAPGDPGGDPGRTEGARRQRSFAEGVSCLGAEHPGALGRTGNAWAARRALLARHRFYDRLILGDGDAFMAYAFTGNEGYLKRRRQEFPPPLIADYQRWAGPVYADVRGRVGVVDGELHHLWHGTGGNRRYGQRRRILLRNGYDPRRHVVRRADGLLAFAEAGARLREAVSGYLRDRDEDGDGGRRRVMVTGMSGVVGGIAGRGLAARYDIVSLGVSAVSGVASVVADLRDVEAMAGAFDGVDTVLHFAAYCAGDAQRHIDVNIRGSYQLLEQALRAGVRRVVVISSGAVQELYEGEEPFAPLVTGRLDEVATPPLLTHLDPVRPARMYGVAKACVENFARFYGETTALSVLCIRLGRVRRVDRPHNVRDAAVYLSHRDLVQLMERCIEAPDSLRFGIYYGVSDNASRFRDLEPARRDLGYQPEDGAGPWQDTGEDAAR